MSKENVLNTLNAALAKASLPEAKRHQPLAVLPTPEGSYMAAFQQALEALGGTSQMVENVVAARLAVLAILQREKAKQVLGWDEKVMPVPGLQQALADLGIIYRVPTITSGSGRGDISWLNDYPVSLTSAGVGIASTGTLILRSGPGRPRVASLVAPLHIVLLPATDIWPTLEAWLGFLRASGQVVDFFGDGVAQQIWISGPSRTADIELMLTLGVHGPRRVHVIIIET